ncbi:tRNA adenosine(34) deaminase TadA [bacterium]|nr:tRNA adenosine(34) deaminase TadA [bacterium]MBU1064898.1 tRNA adenosine(34) deaminase TadA [bacterium]MBU1634316.1 tRNA adenosine(34) deaminase TadA [bacterium]MBU1874582.1 tRNA adenosine(34) deaminase TadA [bacterium]
MNILPHNDEYWINLAFKEAEKAFEKKEIPVGAVIIHNNQIVGRGHNMRESLNDPTAHAEIIAITSAASTLNSWRLDDCTLYVTLEPCAMCAGAVLNARIPRLVFGAYDSQAGMCGSVDNLCDMNLLNHKTIVKGGVEADKCQSILTSFFNTIRTPKSDLDY